MHPENKNSGCKGMCCSSSCPKRIASILLLGDQDFDVVKPSFRQVSSFRMGGRGPISSIQVALDHMHQAVSGWGFVHDCHFRSLKLSTRVYHNRKLLCYVLYMIIFWSARKSSIITRPLTVIQQNTILLSRQADDAYRP
jgi:hypothetical protein